MRVAFTACGWRRVAALVAVGALLATAALAQKPAEVHGSLDAFAVPGLAMAWGVLRASSESETTVVVRVEADPARFGALAVTGVDPFTKRAEPLAARTPLAGPYELRVPRARFADLPRTEWRFFAPGAGEGDAGALLVYFQGVPDTTPEFDDPAKLQADLAQRAGRARDGTGGPR